MGFVERYKAWSVQEGKIGVVWLGQAGFMFKTPEGKTIMLDPYLTDYTYKAIGKGFERMTAPLFDPGDIRADYLFSSHEHQDHWDLDALPFMVEQGAQLFANADSIRLAENYGVALKNVKQIAAGDVVDCGSFKVTAMKCDHGELAPNAMGFMFDFGGVKVYYSGDTCLNLDVLASAIEMHPDVALLPINGAFGNLNAVDAAVFAGLLKCRWCIPHHFWTFPMHNAPMGDPLTAQKYFPLICPECRLDVVTPGQMLTYG